MRAWDEISNDVSEDMKITMPEAILCIKELQKQVDGEIRRRMKTMSELITMSAALAVPTGGSNV